MSKKSDPFQTSDSQSWKADDNWSGEKRGSWIKFHRLGQGLKKKN